MSKTFDNLMKKAFNETITFTRNRMEDYFREISKHIGGDGEYKYMGGDLVIDSKDLGKVVLKVKRGW